MAITTVFFDLDGTLLPMDQDEFVKAYMGLLAKTLAPQGYDPRALIDGIWQGTGAMIRNDGSRINEELFWDVFSAKMGRDCRPDEPLFRAFYENQFAQVSAVCSRTPAAARIIALVKQKGLRPVLATQPIFPAVATMQRIAWAGLAPADFDYITTYENASFSKPNPDYYRQILEKLGLSPAECLMVGNDVGDDMVAETVGMQVFLLTDCLINHKGADISRYPQGGFAELAAFLENL